MQLHTADSSRKLANMCVNVWPCMMSCIALSHFCALRMQNIDFHYSITVGGMTAANWLKRGVPYFTWVSMPMRGRFHTEAQHMTAR